MPPRGSGGGGGRGGRSEQRSAVCVRLSVVIIITAQAPIDTIVRMRIMEEEESSKELPSSRLGTKDQ